MGALLFLDPILLGIVVVTICLVTIILSMTILIFVCNTKTNININLGLGPWILSVLSDENIKSLIEAVKKLFGF
jgi:hypothetical protein